MPKPGFENINVETHSATVDDFIAAGQEDLADYMIAQEIIINALGYEFFEREFSDNSRQNFFTTKYNVKIMHLADLIWRLRDCEGFQQLMLKNRDKEFESTYYELFVAKRMAEISDKVELVAPSGVRGQDFDLRAYNCLGYENVNVEVKARKETFKDRKAVKNFLSACRTQLPSGEVGSVVIKVANEGGISQYDLDSVIEEYLRGTNRIKFITYIWDASLEDTIITFKQKTISREGEITLFPVNIKPLVPSFLIDIQNYRESVGKGGNILANFQGLPEFHTMTKV